MFRVLEPKNQSHQYILIGLKVVRTTQGEDEKEITLVILVPTPEFAESIWSTAEPFQTPRAPKL